RTIPSSHTAATSPPACRSRRRRVRFPLWPRLSPSDRTEMDPPTRANREVGSANLTHPTYPGLAPENLTTLAHFTVSAEINLAKSAVEPANTVAPISANRTSALLSARQALISWLSLSTISEGALFGAPMPYHELAS